MKVAGLADVQTTRHEGAAARLGEVAQLYEC